MVLSKRELGGKCLSESAVVSEPGLPFDFPYQSENNVGIGNKLLCFLRVIVYSDCSVSAVCLSPVEGCFHWLALGLRGVFFTFSFRFVKKFGEGFWQEVSQVYVLLCLACLEDMAGDGGRLDCEMVGSLNY